MEYIISRLTKIFYHKMFKIPSKFFNGKVLDVGGGEFYKIMSKAKFNFDLWINLEYNKKKAFEINDEKYKLVIGNGCELPFRNENFDTVLNLQVLEHVFEPLKMVKEISRVLKPEGHAVFIIPQTATTHMAPQCYYNFTIYWIKEVMKKNGLEIIELKKIGGVWLSTASHMFMFFLQSIRFKGMSDSQHKRNLFFYLLYPFMALYALIGIPICLLFSLGDLTEEVNNHLVVVKKMPST